MDSLILINLYGGLEYTVTYLPPCMDKAIQELWDLVRKLDTTQGKKEALFRAGVSTLHTYGSSELPLVKGLVLMSVGV